MYLALILVLAFSGCAEVDRVDDPPAVAIPEIASVENGLLPAVRVVDEPGWTLEERMAVHNVPGISIAVIDDFELVWAKGYGVADAETGRPVTTETLFQAASISKPVMATAALLQVAAGELALDTPINDSLKSWQLPENELTRVTPVTLRHLLSHSGGTTVHGFPGYAADAEVPTVYQVLDGETPANTDAVRVDIAPGERYRYSGGGSTIAQVALMDLFDKPFPELMNDVVLTPVGMTESTYEQPLPAERLDESTAGHSFAGEPVDGKRHTYPEMAAAGLWTTPSDLARFAIAIQKSWRGDADALLDKETVGEMLTPTPTDSDAGLGLFLREMDDQVFFNHGGGNHGFRCYLFANRDTGDGAVIMTNADGGGSLMIEVLRAIADVYDWKSYLPEPIVPAPVDDLAVYAGRYRFNDDQALNITLRDDRLYAHTTFPPWGQSVHQPMWLIARGDHEFVGQLNDRTYRFIVDGDGVATEVVTVGREENLKPRLDDDVMLPGELLVAGDIERAIAMYREEGAEQGRINSLGYRMLSSRQHEAAIALFRLNTELYPTSANAYDSLADAYFEAGQDDDAIDAWRRVLAVSANDTDADPDDLDALKKKANIQIAKLEARP
ncbi:MAG: serine hydrolase [Acidobacteriota bacterium]